MSLNKFTTAEVRKIQLALELSATYLREGSYLYRRLYRFESRDEELGIDRSNCVKALAEDILSVIDQLKTSYSSEDYGVLSLTESIKDETRRSVTYANAMSISTGLNRRKERLQGELKRELEWINENQICLG